FGAFFEAMVEDLDAGRGSTALVFGVTLLLFFGFGVVSGPLADRFGPRRLVLGGALLLSAGLALTSRVDAVAAGYLTYGVGVGLGGGLIITPMYAAAGGWFVRRRALAMGVVATGNGLGTLVLVPLAERLIADHGWRTAYLVLAGLDLVLLVVAGLFVLRPPIPPAPPAIERMRAVAGITAFRRLFLTGLLFSISLFIAFGFVVDFATAEGVSSSRAALLVGIIGASSIVGRLGLTALSGRVPAVRLLQGCLAVQPLAFAMWLVAGGSYPLLICFALLLGVAYGGFVALGPEAAAVLFGVVGLGGVIGLMFLGAGLGGLIGPPLAGWLADASAGSTVPITLALVVAVVAFVLSLAIPVRGDESLLVAAPVGAAVG
ncbi:MAG: MFS transporter, partial [Actinomycetota bacterium]|nr:MFS transporter [Actinomycetota bacterium]